MHDDRSNINVHDLTLMATTIARSLYALATVDDVKDATAMKHAVASATHLVANSELIETLVNCSVISWNCPLTKEYIPWMIDIAKGKQKGNIDLSADRRLKYLSRINNRYIAVPQVQVLRELLAEVTTSPEQVGVSCDVASLSIEDGATINPNYDLCKINITGYECVNRRYVNTCVLPVFAALGVCVLIGCFSFVSFDCFFFHRNCTQMHSTKCLVSLGVPNKRRERVVRRIKRGQLPHLRTGYFFTRHSSVPPSRRSYGRVHVNCWCCL